MAISSPHQESIKAHKMELEDADALKCEGSSGCTSCVVHLERAAEAQALQFVDQVNHDRMVAWNQLHEHQTRLVQEHYAAVRFWVAARQAPSVSPTLVSPTFKPSEGGDNAWKISDVCGSSDSGSVDFRL